MLLRHQVSEAPIIDSGIADLIPLEPFVNDPADRLPEVVFELVKNYGYLLHLAVLVGRAIHGPGPGAKARREVMRPFWLGLITPLSPSTTRLYFHQPSGTLKKFLSDRVFDLDERQFNCRHQLLCSTPKNPRGKPSRLG